MRLARTLPTRRGVLAFHRIAGLASLLFIVVIGLTGSVLVYRNDIDGVLRPGSYAIAHPERPAVDAATALRSASRADPHGKISGIELPHPSSDLRHRLYSVFVTRDDGEDFVAIDPSTGHVNAVVPASGRGVTQWIYDLHTALLLGAFGRNVVGTVGVVTTFLALAGLALWPGWRNLRAGFSFRRAASARRRSYDLHKVGGIASFVFLAFLAASGSLMTWSRTVDAGLTATLHTNFSAPPVVPRRGARLLTLAQLAERARDVEPGAFVTYVATPVVTQSAYVELARSHDYDTTFGFRTVYLDPYTGAVVRRTGGWRDPLPEWYAFVYPLHVGNFYLHPSYRIAIVVAGLSPLLLSITGSIVLYLKSRRRISFARLPRGRPSTSRGLS